jgi:type I restriction enzyme R subunit
MDKEAKARIKINKLLEESGWRFLDSKAGKANIQLEKTVKLSGKDLDAFGEDFEKTKNGFVDFTLLDDRGFPAAVLEAKKEDKNPLDGKEQARKYALALKARFVILSNGNLHYFWDLESGNPALITKYPTPESLFHSASFKPEPTAIINEIVAADYVALTQMPDYAADPRWIDEAKRRDFLTEKKLKMLRPYQLKAIEKLKDAVKKGGSRFLFEMATGTGKTLLAAAVIKLFLRSGNAKRVLFLVDRLELEVQAHKRFVESLKNDYTTIIYKENRDDWQKAEIVVTTVQSLQFNNKYSRLFAPNDFDLIISDEAHRSISGDSRAVFEYFTGYKLGLTATPKDYLKNIKDINVRDPREVERRQLLDTYITFGCENGIPTYRYSLLDGVKDGFLVNPFVLDGRTKITTQMLSDEGYAVLMDTPDGVQSQTLFHTDFEKRFFSEPTNISFCEAFMKKAMRDPISGEIGKTIVFCVSQIHTSKITQILNKLADKLFPGKYNSDFAIQVTSSITDSQQFSINFSNNNLNGNSRFLEGYKTSKTRVCVTVAMMTTGYDCEDLINLCMMRPVFSPTDFVQMKGRGTRKYNFYFKDADGNERRKEKEKFKLFDYFGNYEYFEKKFEYNEILALPAVGGEGEDGKKPVKPIDIESYLADPMTLLNEISIDEKGMKIDRELYKDFEDMILKDKFIKEEFEKGNMAVVEMYINENIFNKPEAYYSLEKLRGYLKLNRRLNLPELVGKIFGYIPELKTKEQLLQEEVDKFISIYKPDSEHVVPVKNFIIAYITDPFVRDIVKAKEYAQLEDRPGFGLMEYKSVGRKMAENVLNYIDTYVQLNNFNG